MSFFFPPDPKTMKTQSCQENSIIYSYSSQAKIFGLVLSLLWLILKICGTKTAVSLKTLCNNETYMSQYKILIITYCTWFDSIAIVCISFHPPSRPEVTSSPSDPRGSSNGSAVVRQPHAGGKSTSHCNTKTGTLSESKSSLGSHSHDKKGSVKSSVISGASKGPSGVYSGPLAAVQSSVNLHCHGQRLSSSRRSGGTDRRPSSGWAKVSWV